MDKFDLASKKILVTGGAGFIGSHLVDGLLERNATVRVLDNLSTGKRENLDHCRKSIEFIEGDIRDLGVCRTVCRGIDGVFHQAALGSVPRSMKDPATTLDVNVAGTANVLAAARDSGIKRIIFASSSSVYGDSEMLPKKEGEEGKVLSPYALSKVMDEEMAHLFVRCFGMSITGLRYFNVYGSRQDPLGDYAAVIPRFFRACLNGERPVIYGDGEQSRDFTFVGDVVEANLLAMESLIPESFAFYNIAGGTPVAISDLASLIARICGRQDIRPLHEAPRPGDVKHSAADLVKAAKMGFAQKTPLSRGLELSSIYYKSIFKTE